MNYAVMGLPENLRTIQASMLQREVGQPVGGVHMEVVHETSHCDLSRHGILSVITRI
jgi:hypothetical protein